MDIPLDALPHLLTQAGGVQMMLSGRSQQGLRYRMRAAGFERRGQLQAVRASVDVVDSDTLQNRLAHSQRASLVKHHMAGAVQRLQHMRPHDQHAAPQQRVSGGGQRARRGQRQRAGTGDDQHRNGDRPGARGVVPLPEQEDRRGQQQQASDKPGRDAVGPLRQRRLAQARAFGHAHQRGQCAGAGVAHHTQQHRLAGIDRAAGNELASHPLLRRAFAGQQRQVQAGLAVDQHRVGGDRLAWSGQDHVARHKRAGGDRGGVAAGRIGIEPLRRVRQRMLQPFQRLGCAPARGQLQHAAAQQQEDEHGDRVEIHVAAAAYGRHHAGRKRGAYAQRHRHVHGQRTLAQRCPGAAKEGLGRIEHSGQRQQQAGPLHQRSHVGLQRAVRGQVGGHCVHHHLHHAQAGDEQLATQGLAGAAKLGFMPGRVERIGGVADLAHGAEDGAQPALRRVPPHEEPPGRDIHVGCGNAGELAQAALDQPDAGGAAQAIHRQRRFQHAVGGAVLFGGVGVVIQAQLRRQHRVLARFLRVVAAVPVVVADAMVDDGLGHGRAARAAHGLATAVDLDLPATVGRQRQAAMEAAGIQGTQTR